MNPKKYVVIYGDTEQDADTLGLFDSREDALSFVHEFAAAPHDGMDNYDRRDDYVAIAEIESVCQVFVRGLKQLDQPFGFNN